MYFKDFYHQLLTEDMDIKWDERGSDVVYYMRASKDEFLTDMTRHVLGDKSMDGIADDDSDIQEWARDFQIESFDLAYDIFSSSLYHAEGRLTNTTQNLKRFSREITKMLQPFDDVKGQWFVGKCDRGMYVIGVLIDKAYYREQDIHKSLENAKNDPEIGDLFN